jgi:hypothetical protein
MDTPVTPAPTLATAVLQILRPLVRVLLRNGVSFQTFMELVKHMYIDVAMQDLEIPGRRPSVSRVAVLTGLTRKEAQRVMALPAPLDADSRERYNRAARVVSGWVRDADFLAGDGEPRPLAAEEEHGFAELVRRYGGDVPPRAVLDELLRVGAAERGYDGRIRLRARSYIPRTSDRDKLAILGTDVADLIATIDHNMRCGETDPRFQRKVMYDNVPVEVLAEFRALSAGRAQALLERLDEWLSQHDRDVQPSVDGSGRMRVGIGIYYFEENLDRKSTEEAT